jgi:hypothetical protein
LSTEIDRPSVYKGSERSDFSAPLSPAACIFRTVTSTRILVSFVGLRTSDPMALPASLGFPRGCIRQFSCGENILFPEPTALNVRPAFSASPEKKIVGDINFSYLFSLGTYAQMTPRSFLINKGRLRCTAFRDGAIVTCGLYLARSTRNRSDRSCSGTQRPDEKSCQQPR